MKACLVLQKKKKTLLLGGRGLLVLVGWLACWQLEGGEKILGMSILAWSGSNVEKCRVPLRTGWEQVRCRGSLSIGSCQYCAAGALLHLLHLLHLLQKRS